MAQSSLGSLYFRGTGVPQDFSEAVKWFRKAAEQRLRMAHAKLGVMYSRGLGVRQDYVLGYMWFYLFAQKSGRGATKSLNKIAERMTPAQIAEAQKLAREWLEKHKKK